MSFVQSQIDLNPISRFRRGDIVYNAGIQSKDNFMVSGCKFSKSGAYFEYELEGLVGGYYRKGVWVREGDLRLSPGVTKTPSSSDSKVQRLTPRNSADSFTEVRPKSSTSYLAEDRISKESTPRSSSQQSSFEQSYVRPSKDDVERESIDGNDDVTMESDNDLGMSDPIDTSNLFTEGAAGTIHLYSRLDVEVMSIPDSQTFDSRVLSSYDQKRLIVAFAVTIGQEFKLPIHQGYLSAILRERLCHLFAPKVKQYARGVFTDTVASIGCKGKRSAAKTIYCCSETISILSIEELLSPEYDPQSLSLQIKKQGDELILCDKAALLSHELDDIDEESVLHTKLDHQPADGSEILTYLTRHRMFSVLRSELGNLLQHYFIDTMVTIKNLVGQLHPQSMYSSVFEADCDIHAFIQQQYGTALKHVSHMLAITGNGYDAQLTTVGLFFSQTWPSYPNVLLDVLQNAVFGEEKTTAIASGNSANAGGDCMMIIRNGHINVVSCGTPEYLYNVGQQVAWLGAVCRVPQKGTVYCNTVCGVISPFSSTREIPKVSFRYNTVHLDEAETSLCWHRLTGNMVIVTGFPIPNRPKETKGLEIPLEIMAKLGRTLLVEDFGSGIVLKGDTGAFDFFPVGRSGEHVQWHLVNSAGNALVYEDGSQSSRLGLLEFSIEDLATTVACLGWTPDVTNNAGTMKIEFEKIRPSRSSQVSERSMNPTGIQFGISKLIGVSVPFTISPTQFAPEIRKLDLYEENLRDLAERSVVFYDTETRRGWLLDAERAVLQILIHRREAGQFDPNVEFGFTDAQNDVRSVMRVSCQKKLRKDMDLGSMEEKDVFFALEVKKIREKLVQLAFAAQVEYRRISQSVASRRKVIGFEYMDIIQAPEIATPLVEELDESYGEWPQLVHRQLCATVLFASNFQEIFLPKEAEKLCRPYRTVPSHKSYLAAETAQIQKLVTTKALSLAGTGSFYPVCTHPEDDTIPCLCMRVQTIRKGGNTSVKALHNAESQSGALILGHLVRNSWSRSRALDRERSTVSKLIRSTNNMSPVWGVKIDNFSVGMREDSIGQEFDGTS